MPQSCTCLLDHLVFSTKFEEEFLTLLNAHEIEVEERYLWK